MSPDRILGLMLGTLLTVGCSAPRASTEPMKSTTLENVQWTLVQLEGKAIEVGSRGAPTLMLSSKDKRLSGFAGCNRMIGGYELDGDALRFSGVATTRMACIDVTPEESLLRTLGAVARWNVSGSTLELLDASGTVRSSWTATAIESGASK
jgi:heat shock protein HslJ